MTRAAVVDIIPGVTTRISQMYEKGIMQETNVKAPTSDMTRGMMWFRRHLAISHLSL
jgi:hypothetical protein